MRLDTQAKNDTEVATVLKKNDTQVPLCEHGRRTDGQTDGRRQNNIPQFFFEKWGIKIICIHKGQCQEDAIEKITLSECENSSYRQTNDHNR